jgi:hypothetical protein
MNKKGIKAVLVALLLGFPAVVLAGADVASKFTGKGTIANTRHNLTQKPKDQVSSTNPLDESQMKFWRNQYNDVCVYCHTPHGANTQAGIQGAPLWNRSYVETTYEMYDQLGTSTLTPGSVSANRPGVNSLTCLSCHDGTVAIDSIINMPGSDGYVQARETDGQSSTLNEWATKFGGNQADHATLAPGDQTCMSCHATGKSPSFATDFDSFYIGKDLKNDHPVGVTFPIGNADFNQPGGTKGGSKYFDNNTNSRMDPAEVRTYNSKVECASCHDPHGVPKGTIPGINIDGDRVSNEFIKTFLRVSNDNSRLCMTCHIK